MFGALNRVTLTRGPKSPDGSWSTIKTIGCNCPSDEIQTWIE